MKKPIQCIAIIGTLASCIFARADVVLNSAFEELYTIIGDTNVSQSAFLDGIADGSSDWLGRYASARVRINDQTLRGWFCTMAEASVTNVAEYSERSSWLHAKTMAICNIGIDNVVRGDTNCWFAVAREHGRIRIGIHSDAELDAMRGAISRQVDGNGVAIISVPDISSEESHRRHVEVNALAQMEGLDKDFLSGINGVFAAFATSDTLNAFPVVQRNAIVSNLVETARLTPAEASSLGLTNVVQTLLR
jgi:hypothetical protein